MASQHDKGERFRALHAGPGIFVIPNPWDAGSAKLLASMGFPALATTSAGFAFSLGRQDGTGAVGRAEAIANCRQIAEAVDLPVSGDLENGYGDRPEDAAATVRAAAEAGLVGCSIEDSTGRPEAPIYDRTLAVERVTAAVEAARALPFPFVLTARSENFLQGIPDLDDTLARLAAYEAAGADVLYAPRLDLEQLRTVCASVGRPVNALARPDLRLADLADAGVKRISVGSGLFRAAIGAMLQYAQAAQREGRFDWLADAAPFAKLQERFGPSDAA
jgi:2-methylisocitrate lyase-like PEP mutase family enzyme